MVISTEFGFLDGHIFHLQQELTEKSNSVVSYTLVIHLNGPISVTAFFATTKVLVVFSVRK